MSRCTVPAFVVDVLATVAKVSRKPADR